MPPPYSYRVDLQKPEIRKVELAKRDRSSVWYMEGGVLVCELVISGHSRHCDSWGEAHEYLMQMASDRMAYASWQVSQASAYTEAVVRMSHENTRRDAGGCDQS